MPIGVTRVCEEYYLGIMFPFEPFSWRSPVRSKEAFATLLEAQIGQRRKKIDYYKSHTEPNINMTKEKYLSRRKKAVKMIPTLIRELDELAEKYPHAFI